MIIIITIVIITTIITIIMIMIITITTIRVDIAFRNELYYTSLEHLIQCYLPCEYFIHLFDTDDVR